MRRITLFLKGNVDVYDSLHSCRVGGRVCWNGLNQVVRTLDPGLSIRIRHETSTGSRSLLATTGSIPDAFAGHDLPLGAYPLESQFSNRLFETDADAIVLSIMPDIVTRLMRHRRDGFLFLPYGATNWPAHEREWLRREFVDVAALTPDESMDHLERTVDRIRERSSAPILVYNLSAVMPGEQIHCHAGLDESFSTAVRRFNLGLIDLSARTGLSIVDVDAVVARAGADRLRLDAQHLHPDGYRLVAEEVARILADLGLFEREVDACARA